MEDINRKYKYLINIQSRTPLLTNGCSGYGLIEVMGYAGSFLGKFGFGSKQKKKKKGG